MRTLVIELPLEPIESLLLAPRVPLRWLERGRLQRRVHALMGAVILRRGWPGTFRQNGQLYPPHGTWAEAARREAGEGIAVIGVDRQRQSILVKGCLEDG